MQSSCKGFVSLKIRTCNLFSAAHQDGGGAGVSHLLLGILVGEVMAEEVGIGGIKIGVTVVGGGVEGVTVVQAGTHLYVLISPGDAAKEAMPAGSYIQTLPMVPPLTGDMREVEVVEDEEVDKMIARKVTMVVVATVVAAADLAGVKKLHVHAEDGSLVMRKKKITTKNHRNPLINYRENNPRRRL